MKATCPVASHRRAPGPAPAAAASLFGGQAGRLKVIIAGAALAALVLSPASAPGAASAGDNTTADGTDERRMVLEMEPLIAPVFGPGKVLGHAYVAIRLSLKDRKLSKVVIAGMPWLGDAFFQYLHRYGWSGAFEDGKLDLDRLKRDFQYTADRILGAGVVEVLIHQAQLFQRR